MRRGGKKCMHTMSSDCREIHAVAVEGRLRGVRITQAT
jgi:hypothetical protein